ncbi:MAG: YbjN domain-containing protein [Alphaproteobacteria bacterium]|jgi:hypothetical protein|nr:YbjN domain-containing protein [Alphaproteobacteria bacterium]
MDLTLDDDDGLDADDPLALAEAVMNDDPRFEVERIEDHDLQFSFQAPWGEAVGFFSYRAELPAVLFTFGLDLAAPEHKRAEAASLCALINENLWLGHFDVWSEDGAIVMRHSLPMVGRSEVSEGEFQALLAAALDAADRFQPAFALLIHGGYAPAEAAKASLFETVGEA